MSVQAISCAFALRGISSSEKLVLLALANYADENMRCWPSQETLARETELSERTVWGALKSLEEKRVLSRQQRKRSDGTRTTDVFTLHFCLTITSEPVAKAAKSTRKSCEDQSQILREPVAAVATLTTFEPSREPSEEEPSEAAASGASAPAHASDWTREHLDRLEARLREAAGQAINPVSPNLLNVSAVVRLLTPGAGPACDLELDVLATIRAKAAKIRAGSVKGWDYFAPLIVEARDARLAGAPAPRAKERPAIVRDDDFWRVALRRWRADPSQWTASMGPLPDEPGCLIPPHILQETEQIRSAA